MNQKIVRRTLDILMTIISVFLMGGLYLFSREAVHEILGTVLIAIWILHNAINFRFYKSIFKGKYNARRVMFVFINCSLVVFSILLAVSGIILSNTVFSFLKFENGIVFARAAHLAISHWYFIFIALHFALNATRLFDFILNRKSIWAKIFVRVLMLVIFVNGAFWFIKFGLYKYLFLTQQFFFFDYSQNIILFFINYTCIFLSFSILMNLIIKIFNFKKK